MDLIKYSYERHLSIWGERSHIRTENTAKRIYLWIHVVTFIYKILCWYENYNHMRKMILFSHLRSDLHAIVIVVSTQFSSIGFKILESQRKQFIVQEKWVTTGSGSKTPTTMFFPLYKEITDVLHFKSHARYSLCYSLFSLFSSPSNW